jgi:hypothetical protein
MIECHTRKDGALLEEDSIIFDDSVHAKKAGSMVVEHCWNGINGRAAQSERK